MNIFAYSIKNKKVHRIFILVEDFILIICYLCVVSVAYWICNIIYLSKNYVR